MCLWIIQTIQLPYNFFFFKLNSSKEKKCASCSYLLFSFWICGEFVLFCSENLGERSHQFEMTEIDIDGFLCIIPSHTQLCDICAITTAKSLHKFSILFLLTQIYVSFLTVHAYFPLARLFNVFFFLIRSVRLFVRTTLIKALSLSLFLWVSESQSITIFRIVAAFIFSCQ